MKKFFNEPNSSFTRVLKNLFILLSGRATAGILFFISIIISARLLEPSDLGLIVMLHAYVMTVRGVITVKPFEAIVKYGTIAADNADFDRLGKLLVSCMKLDVITALLGFTIASFGISILIDLQYLEPKAEKIGWIYCLLLLIANDGTAVGSLRIWNKFNYISYCLIGGALSRLLGIVTLYIYESLTLTNVAYVWFFSSCVQYLLLQATGWFLILDTLPKPLRHYLTPFNLCELENHGIWRFLHLVYWQGVLDTIPKRGGILLSGFFLGPEIAALYRITNDLAGVIAKPALLVRQVIFPDLARLKNESSKNLPLTLKVSLIVSLPAALLAIASFWFGEDLLSFTVGEDYTIASVLLTILILSATLELASSPLRPFLYVADSAGISLAIQVFGTIAYIGIFYIGIETLNLLTPGIASLTLNISTLVLAATAIFISRIKRENRASS